MSTGRESGSHVGCGGHKDILEIKKIVIRISLHFNIIIYRYRLYIDIDLAVDIDIY